MECRQIRVNDQKIQEIVLRAIVTQCRLLDAKIQRMSNSNAAGKDQRKLLENENRQCHKKLEILQEEKMRLYESYVMGSVEKEDFLTKCFL